MTSRYCYLGCILAILCMWANIGMAQTLPDEVEIEVEFSEVPIDSAIYLLIQSSQVNISFNPDHLPDKARRTVAVKRMKLGLVLDDILHNTGLIYKIVGNQLVIKENPKNNQKEYITVSGVVEDERTGERLVYANIHNQDYSIGTTSNEYGYYTLRIPKRAQFITFSYLGYKKYVLPINSNHDLVHNIYMTPANFLNEVTIIKELPKAFELSEQYDDIPIDMMNSMTSLAGEADLFRLVQLRAGVNTAADGLGGLNIRGGTPDQNLILLDGVPVYNTGHALGLFSVFNPSTIKRAKLIKSGIPARFGGRLSSVLDIRTKEGNKKSYHGEVSINPFFITRGMIEGPIVKNQSSFMVSGRRTILDPWLKPLSRAVFENNEEDGRINYVMYDVNAKFNFIFGTKNELYLSAYKGNDFFESDVTSFDNAASTQHESISRWEWGNELASLRWGHYLTEEWTAYLTLGYSRFRFDNYSFDRNAIVPLSNNSLYGYQASAFSSDIRDLIGRLDMDQSVAKYWRLRYGVEYTDHQLEPRSNSNTTRSGLVAADDPPPTADMIYGDLNYEEIVGKEYRAYVENHLTFGDVHFNLGMHWSRIDARNNTYQMWQPRMSVGVNVSDRTTLKMGYSAMNQYFHLLTPSGFGLPNDLWVATTDNLAPQRSNEYSLGINYDRDGDLRLGFNTYFKRFYDVSEFGLGTGSFIRPVENSDWEDDLLVGDGRSYGLELEMEKQTGRLKTAVNYTLSKSERRFDSINEGQYIDARNDRRHAFKVNSLFIINDNVEMNVAWQYSSGVPYTTPISVVDVPVDNRLEQIIIYGDYNNASLPAYHRLDLSFNIYTEYAWGRQKLSVGAYNLYNRQNPFYLDVDFDRSTDLPQLEQVSVLPIIPFVNLSIAF